MSCCLDYVACYAAPLLLLRRSSRIAVAGRGPGIDELRSEFDVDCLVFYATKKTNIRVNMLRGERHIRRARRHTSIHPRPKVTDELMGLLAVYDIQCKSYLLRQRARG